jgi:F0F1-type ATP synthase membrane subunit b/b'
MMQNIQMPNDSQEKNAHNGMKTHEKVAKDVRENEKFIQQVLEIEKNADQVHDKAVHEAELMPIQAGQEAQAIIDKARKSAQEEADRLVNQAKVQEQSADILAEAEKNIQHIEKLASTNFNKAVSYVVARVIGRE